MEFQIKVDYTRKTGAAISKALRKTVRKTRSRILRILSVLILLLLVICLIPLDGSFVLLSPENLASLLCIMLLLIQLIWEDSISGWFFYRAILPGAHHVDAVFTPEGYCTRTQLGNTSWYYGTITAIVESRQYLIFVFGKKHIQAYDKSTLTGGSPDQFRALLEQATGKPILSIERNSSGK